MKKKIRKEEHYEEIVSRDSDSGNRRSVRLMVTGLQ